MTALDAVPVNGGGRVGDGHDDATNTNRLKQPTSFLCSPSSYGVWTPCSAVGWGMARL